MPQVKKINAITERFIAIHKHLKDKGELPDVKTLSEIMGYKSYSIISDILARRANIRPDAFNEFKGSFRACIPYELLSDSPEEKQPAKITEGEYLKRAIRGRGMTIEEAAAKLGLSRSNLHFYMNKDILSVEFKNQVSVTLGIDFNEGSAIPLPSSNMLVISEADLRRLITECVNDALRQFIMKAAS